MLKSIITIITLLLSAISFAQSGQTDSTVYREARIYDARMGNFLLPDSVFVCDNGLDGKYHLNKDCKGLNNCKHSITKEEYIKSSEKRELCGYED
tara:strand:- start:2209 stop:2493 length:285 start_codon:yes stop_codon:yes gene_type:complete